MLMKTGPAPLIVPAADSVLESGERWIGPLRGLPQLNLEQVWAQRGVVFVLALRDVKVRYRQRIVGIGWVLLQPLLTMAVMTLVFSRIVDVSDHGVPYPTFSLSALVTFRSPCSAPRNGATGSLGG